MVSAPVRCDEAKLLYLDREAGPVTLVRFFTVDMSSEPFDQEVCNSLLKNEGIAEKSSLD